MSQEATTDQPQEHHHEESRIRIDRVEYAVTQRQLTGAEIRHIPPEPIGPDRDLFEVVPGHPDHKIEDSEIVDMKNGLRFFTAPAHINPGSSVHR